MRYASVYARLVANVSEPSNDQGCWCWSRKKDRQGYGRVTLWVPGLGRHEALNVHVVMWIYLNTEARTWQDIWLAAQELRCANLEIDHLCYNPTCLNPDHLDLKTKTENIQARRDTWRNIEDRPPEQTVCPWCDVEGFAWELCGSYSDTSSCTKAWWG